MVILRATQRVLRLLPQRSGAAESSETALGDWYVNRIVVQRQPVLLLVSSSSLLPVLTPARDVRTLPQRLPDIIAARLERMQISSLLIAAEVAAMERVVVAPTRDRSVLGILVDFGSLLQHHVHRTGWHDAAMLEAEAHLEGTPCYASRRFAEVIFPVKTAPSLLAARWSTGGVTASGGLPN